MLARDDDECLGAARFDVLALAVEARVELIALFDVLDHVGTTGNARSVAQDTRVDEAHRFFSSSVKLLPPPVIA